MNRNGQSDQGQSPASDSTTVSKAPVTSHSEGEIMPNGAAVTRLPEHRLSPAGHRRYVAPMTASAHTVAAALHARRTGLGPSKLNSLLYFCQGHHLADLGEPLFAEPLFAVANGAVVETFTSDATERLAGEQLSTVGAVIARYGNLSPGDLRTLVWNGDPWKLAAARPEDPRIEWMWLQDWFTRTALDPEVPTLNRDQIAKLAEKAMAMPDGPGVEDTRETIQARIDALRERSAGAP